MINKKCGQSTKYSEVIITFNSIIIAIYWYSLDPPLYCLGLNRSCFAFRLWSLVVEPICNLKKERNKSYNAKVVVLCPF